VNPSIYYKYAYLREGESKIYQIGEGNTQPIVNNGLRYIFIQIYHPETKLLVESSIFFLEDISFILLPLTHSMDEEVTSESAHKIVKSTYNWKSVVFFREKFGSRLEM
jgi:hypothetical protein